MLRLTIFSVLRATTIHCIVFFGLWGRMLLFAQPAPMSITFEQSIPLTVLSLIDENGEEKRERERESSSRTSNLILDRAVFDRYSDETK